MRRRQAQSVTQHLAKNRTVQGMHDGIASAQPQVHVTKRCIGIELAGFLDDLGDLHDPSGQGIRHGLLRIRRSTALCHRLAVADFQSRAVVRVRNQRRVIGADEVKYGCEATLAAVEQIERVGQSRQTGGGNAGLCGVIKFFVETALDQLFQLVQALHDVASLQQQGAISIKAVERQWLAEFKGSRGDFSHFSGSNASPIYLYVSPLWIRGSAFTGKHITAAERETLGPRRAQGRENFRGQRRLNLFVGGDGDPAGGGSLAGCLHSDRRWCRKHARQGGEHVQAGLFEQLRLQRLAPLRRQIGSAFQVGIDRAIVLIDDVQRGLQVFAPH